MEREDALRQIRERRNAWIEAIQLLRKDQELYTKWEPLWEDQCRIVLGHVLAMQSLVGEWTNFFRGPLVGTIYGREMAPIITQLQYLYMQSDFDEAALAVRVYIPHSHQETERAFRLQITARDQLLHLINKVQDVLDLIDKLIPPVEVTIIQEQGQ